MAHVLGILAVICYLLCFQFKTRKNIIIVNLLSRLFYILQYVFLNALSGAVLEISGLIFSYIAKEKERKFIKKHYIFFVVLTDFLLLAAGLLSYDNIYSLFAISGIIIEITALWLTKEKNMRMLSVFSLPLWFVYNLKNGAYGSVAGNIIVTISILTAMIRLDFKKEK